MNDELNQLKEAYQKAVADGLELKRQRDEVEKERDSALDMLQLILPMAKGYAAEHQAGNNQKFVEMAEKLLK